MSTAEVEEKLGKVYTRLEEAKGRINQLWDAVFGNGIPGHEKRIGEIEEILSNRRETCPFQSDKTNRQVVIGLWINGFMMISGFVAIIVTMN